MRVLVFAPHPDDELIGCGGSIAKHISNDNEVSVVYLTSGDAGGLNNSKKELESIREAEAKESCNVIGISDLIFLRNPDGYLENNKDNLIKTVKIIRDKKPDIVYIPHEKERHRDHKTTNELVLQALHRAKGKRFQECGNNPWSVDIVLGYEVQTPLQEVEYTEDISQFIDLKVEALKKHESQINGKGYHEAIEGLNKYRGITTGKGEHCECFKIIKRETLVNTL